MADISSSKHPGAEGFYRVLLENANDAIFIVDTETMQIMDANRAALERLGYTREELVQLKVPQIHPPEDAARTREVMRKLQAGEGVVVSEVSHRRKDGTLIPVEVSVTPVTVGDRRYNLAIARDLSEKLRAEEIFRVLFEKSSDAIFLVDPETLRFIEVNEEACRSLGYSRQELMEVELPRIASEISREEIIRIFSQIREGRGPTRVLASHRRKDGALFPVEMRVSMITLGGRARMLATVRDITEQVRSGKELEEAKAFLEHLQESAEDGLVLLDERGNVVSSNRKAVEIWGGRREESLGRSFLEFQPPEDVPASREAFEKVIAGQSVRIQSRVRTVAGEIRHVEVSAGPLERRGKKYALAIVRDVTERVHDEAALRSIAEGTASVTGEPFFRSLVRHLATALQMKYALLARCVDEPPTRVKTLAFWAGEDFAPELEYDLKDTPCEGVMFGKASSYVSGIQKHFPRDDTLKELSAESYMGVPLQDAEGKVIGHLVVMHDRPLDDVERDMAILRIFASRAGAELVRREAEDALRESEERWRSLVANAPDHIMTVDRVGRILSINYTMPDLTIEGVLGRSVYEFMAPESHEVSRAAIEKAFRSGESSSYEVTRQGSDGEPQWFSSRVGPVYRDGQVIAAVIIATDITEQKRAEQQLADLAEERGLLLSRTRDFVYRHDAQGVFTYMSPSIEQISGRSIEVWLTHYTEYLTDNPINQKVIEYTEETLRTGKQSPPYLVEVFHADGRRITLEVVENPYFEDGKVAGVVGVGRDVTERLQAEEELRFQKSLLESTSEAAIDGILVVSSEGKMVSFNRRFLQMWEVSPEIAESRSDDAALESVLNKLKDPEEFLSRVRYLYAHPSEESHEEILLKDGRTFDRYSAPVRSHEGTIYGRVWYFRDVTGRKRTEEELRRAAEETRRAYEDLKRAQAQLIRSEKLASIGMLVSGVAHELNNPLNVMYGNLKLLADACQEISPLAEEGARRMKVKGVPGRLRKFKGMIRDAVRAAEHARGIVDDFRGFARDVRTAELVDLNRCLEEALTLLQREIQPRIKLVRRLRRIPSVRCMRGQMSQVFLNLLTNAVEAIDRRGTITLRTHQKNGRVVVEVADTGRGMPDGVRRKLFEPFFTTKPRGKGLGLGLSISAMIVHNHGGELTCTSRPGKGSVFRLELPVRA